MGAWRSKPAASPPALTSRGAAESVGFEPAPTSRAVRSREFRAESVAFQPEYSLLAAPERRWPATAAPLFATTAGPLVYAQYSWWATWHVAKVRSRDVDGTFTVVWEDGTLQIGTLHAHQSSPNSAQVQIAGVTA